MDVRYRNSNRYYTQPPVSTDYAENSEPVLQKPSGCLVMIVFFKYVWIKNLCVNTCFTLKIDVLVILPNSPLLHRKETTSREHIIPSSNSY